MEPNLFDRNLGRRHPTLDSGARRTLPFHRELPPRGLSEPPDFSRVVLGGFVGTTIMTLLMYAGPLIGIPNLDLAGMLGALLIGSVPEVFSGPWWAGMVWHFINGALLFPLIYAYLILDGKKGTPTTKGVLWGLTLWTLAQVVVMPVMGGGFFSSATMSPFGVVLGSLVAHLIYGAALGSVSKQVVASGTEEWSRSEEHDIDRAA